MATPSVPSNESVIQSFRGEFHFQLAEPEKRRTNSMLERVGTLEYVRRHGLAALDGRHPFYAVLNQQADMAADAIRAVEAFLNQPGRFIMPISTGPVAIAPGHECVLAISKNDGKWRIAVHSCTWHSVGVNTDRHLKRVVSRRKRAWLECGILEKVVTIRQIPDLLESLLKQIESLAWSAFQNDAALARVNAAMTSFANPTASPPTAR